MSDPEAPFVLPYRLYDELEQVNLSATYASNFQKSSFSFGRPSMSGFTELLEQVSKQLNGIKSKYYSQLHNFSPGVCTQQKVTG